MPKGEKIMIQVYLDTETTGVENGACVIELAAIMVEDGEVIDTFHEYCKPYRPVAPAAFKAHGISNAFLADKPEEKEVLQRFVEWILGSGAKEVLAYNAQFDIRIVNDRVKMDHIMERNLFDDFVVVDVAKYARKAIADGKIQKNGRTWNQEYVASCFGIKYDAHSAIEDVKAMMQIYKNLLKLGVKL